MLLNHSGYKIKCFIVTHRQCALSWMEMKEDGGGVEGEDWKGRLGKGVCGRDVK